MPGFQTLDSEEPQGFAIADPYAPFVFINSKDWAAPQLFTLVHELAHIWIAATGISADINEVDEIVVKCLRAIYAANSIHITLVANVKGRSLADPWVIAHAMREGAAVVTKEEKVTALNANRIKILNVCESMGVEWMNDFGMIWEVGITFNCLRTN